MIKALFPLVSLHSSIVSLTRWCFFAEFNVYDAERTGKIECEAFLEIMLGENWTLKEEELDLPQPGRQKPHDYTPEFFCDDCGIDLKEGHDRWECILCPDAFCLCADCHSKGHKHPTVLSRHFPHHITEDCYAPDTHVSSKPAAPKISRRPRAKDVLEPHVLKTFVNDFLIYDMHRNGALYPEQVTMLAAYQLGAKPERDELELLISRMVANVDGRFSFEEYMKGLLGPNWGVDSSSLDADRDGYQPEFFCDVCGVDLKEGYDRWECLVCPDTFCLCAHCHSKGHKHPPVLSRHFPQHITEPNYGAPPSQ